MGLQIPDSPVRIRVPPPKRGRDGGIGRRKGLKILRALACAGSSPALGTSFRLIMCN